VDSIRVTQGASVLYLRVLDGKGSVIPVHIGEAESSSLQKEINKQRQARGPTMHHTPTSMQPPPALHPPPARAPPGPPPCTPHPPPPSPSRPPAGAPPDARPAEEHGDGCVQRARTREGGSSPGRRPHPPPPQAAPVTRAQQPARSQTPHIPHTPALPGAPQADLIPPPPRPAPPRPAPPRPAPPRSPGVQGHPDTHHRHHRQHILRTHPPGAAQPSRRAGRGADRRGRPPQRRHQPGSAVWRAHVSRRRATDAQPPHQQPTRRAGAAARPQLS
jgi:hypothetical protein